MESALADLVAMEVEANTNERLITDMLKFWLTPYLSMLIAAYHGEDVTKRPPIDWSQFA